MDPQRVYRWRHSEGVTHHRSPMRRPRPAAPAFVPIVTDAMPTGEAAPTALATPVIEISLAGDLLRPEPLGWTATVPRRRTDRDRQQQYRARDAAGLVIKEE